MTSPPGKSGATGRRATGRVRTRRRWLRWLRRWAPRRSRGLLAPLALGGLGVARDDRRVHVLEHGLARDDHLRDVLALARDVVHDAEQHLLEDRAQTTRASAAQDRLVGD